MNEATQQFYREIAQALADTAPEDWSAAWVTGVVGDDYAITQYDYQSENGKEAWFEPGDAGNDKIAMALMGLRRAMRQPGLQPWNNITFRVERSGKFHADFRHDPKDDL